MFNGILTNDEATQVRTHSTRIKVPKSFRQSKVGSQKPENCRKQRPKGEKKMRQVKKSKSTTGRTHNTTKDLRTADKDNLAATRGKPVASNGIGQRHRGAAHQGGGGGQVIGMAGKKNTRHMKPQRDKKGHVR